MSDSPMDSVSNPTRSTKNGSSERISLTLRLVNLAVVVLPFLGFLAVVIAVWGWGIHWVDLALLLGMYALTAIGITVGYHRLFTHRAFETRPVVKFVLAVLGSMAVEGPLLKWVAIHRRHHQHSDKAEDPHSPHAQEHGFVGVLRGFWHAHMGWFFQPDPPELPRYVKDLRENRALRAASALFPLWAILSLLVPAALGGLLMRSWMGIVTGLLWGGLARIFLVHHVTWSINSICHLWGSRPFRTSDESRNNFIFGALGFGEGWHNNHHAFPTSAQLGLRWWQIDLGYWMICVLAWFGLASGVRKADWRAK